MSAHGPGELPYEAKARLADNLFVLRLRAGFSLETLGKLAAVTSGGIGAMERGKTLGRLESYIRIAGALGVELDDLMAGVAWTPPVIEAEIEPAYEVEFNYGPSGDSEQAMA